MQYFYYGEVSSTMDTARQLLTQGVCAPFVVRADMQTQGRGRQENIWISPAGNLFFSYVRETNTIACDVSLASLWIALSLKEIMSKLFPCLVGKICIKWPNDILIEGQKVAGILIEPFSVTRRDTIVIGIGFNIVNCKDQRTRSFSATALENYVEKSPSAEALLQSIIDPLEAALGQTSSIVKESIMHQAPQMYLYNQPVKIYQGAKCYEGIFAGLDSNGYLILQSRGKTQHFASGSLRSCDTD